MSHKNDILKFGTPFAEHLLYGNWLNLFKNTAYTYQSLYLKFEDIWIYGIAFSVVRWYRYDMNGYR